ncbi:helix-turn-helix domain-containing protein, partial [Streptomyces sp. NPDC046909]|uniref:helix-turn-helix domain-containing protein n=1 Tax=Streptomyces sp. NPDC046909 TaxID=3155617 RepID=UPI0033D22256
MEKRQEPPDTAKDQPPTTTKRRGRPGMPGGRLTQQDRQQIALGLSDGLAYAEIARRLDRPTST